VSFPRCRHCKSPVNPHLYRRCIGCGADILDTLPPAPRARAGALQEGTKDAGQAAGILSVIGGLGIFGFFPSMFLGNGYLMILSAMAAIAGIVVWIARIGSGGQDRTGPSCLGVFAMLFLCGVALLFGLGILLGFACIGNGGRFD